MATLKRQRSSSRTVAGKSPNGQPANDPTLQQAYEELAVSEARFRELYEKAPDMYHTLDMDGNFLELNPKHREILGYTYEELDGHHFSEIVAEHSLRSLEEG